MGNSMLMEDFDHRYLEELATKWKNRTLTEQEQAYFDRWYNSTNSELLELPEGYAKDAITIRDRMHDQIKVAIRQDRKQQLSVAQRMVWQLAIAAAILLSLVIVGYYYFRNKSETPQLTVQNSNYVAPGQNKAILTLAGGKSIQLDCSGIQAIALQGASSVTARSGRLVYNSDKNISAIAAVSNTLTTPKGGQYQLVLPDGTHVWLNAQSSIKFPSAFTGKERTVVLNGEAYFEVAHNKEMPFIVETHDQYLQVLGTHFNINAYTDEKATVTTLSQGAVRLTSGKETVQLKPGQQSVLNDKQYTIAKIDTTLALAWKEGQFAFAKTSIQTVLRQVSRWYNIDIVYKGQAPDFTLSGEVSRKEDLSAILKILQASDVHFVQQGRRLTITP